jgi:hypothetical protein
MTQAYLGYLCHYVKLLGFFSFLFCRSAQNSNNFVASEKISMVAAYVSQIKVAGYQYATAAKH